MEYFDEISKNVSLEIEEILSKYEGIRISKLLGFFDVNIEAKNSFNILTMQMIKNSNTRTIQDLIKNNICDVKTIKLDKYNQLKESISLPVFRYCDIVNEKWESSKLRRYFLDKTFLFAIYKKIDNEYSLNNLKLWKMPKDILDNSVRIVWDKLINCINTGQIVKYIDNKNRYFNYFPSSYDNPYVHIRPHAINRSDTFPLPFPDKVTGLREYPKHSFWLNRAYILKIIQRDINS